MELQILKRNSFTLPHVLLIGTSNIKGIVPDKLTHAAEVHTEIKYTIQDATTFVSNFSNSPNVLVLHVLCLTVNTNKTKILIFNKAGRHTDYSIQVHVHAT